MITGRTRIYGIFGFPVEHTFSPAMHNAAFRALKMDSCYIPFAVHPDRLRLAAAALLPLGICGLNVTVPHKVQILRHLDELSEEARLIGAVNTIEVRKGRLIGHNTDGRGFLRSLKEEADFEPRGKRFVCLGSGGAARAVAFSLALQKAAGIAFWNRDVKKAERLARDVRRSTGAKVDVLRQMSSLKEITARADCLINATSLGLKKEDPLPLASDLIGPHHLVCDLVYNPARTPFLKAAKARGARTLSGIGMLLYQGVIAFEVWTGKKAPVPVMRRALLRQVRSR